MHNLTTVPLEILDGVLQYCSQRDVIALHYSCRSLYAYLRPRAYTRLYIGPSASSCMLDEHGVNICGSNIATIVQMIHSGAMDGILAQLNHCVVVNCESYPLTFMTPDKFPRMKKIDVKMTGTSHNHDCIVDFVTKFRSCQTDVDYKGNWIPDSIRPQITKLSVTDPVIYTLDSLPRLRRLKIVASSDMHATSLLQLVSGLTSLESLHIDTMRLVNPLAINFIPRQVKELEWVDRSTAPALFAYPPPVRVDSVTKLSITTLLAFDVAQYSFPNIKQLEMHSLVNDSELHLPKLMCQRLRQLAGNAKLENLVFDFPIRFLPEITTSMKCLTLNPRYKFDNVQSVLKSCPDIARIIIEYRL